MNLYWSIYESLEEEVLRLADDIFFNDDQLKVYSVTIGNLIVRCAIEIESLAKELYHGLGGKIVISKPEKRKSKPPLFDKECLDLLIKTWKIDQKKIKIVSSKMFFSKDNSILMPLVDSNKYGDKGSPWKRAYQEFKHNRAQGIEETATVKNLLGALGALYILNLYNRNDLFWHGIPIEGREEYQSPSKIFSPAICDVSFHAPFSDDEELFKSNTNIPIDEAIYLKKYTDDAATWMRDWFYEVNWNIGLQTLDSDELLKHLQKHPESHFTIDASLIAQLGLNIREMAKRAAIVRTIPPEIYRQKEIVLNKCQRIYPKQTWEDFKETSKTKEMLEKKVDALNQKLSSEQG